MLVGLTTILPNCEIAEWVKSASSVDYVSAVAPRPIGSRQHSCSCLDQNRTLGGLPENTATLSGCCSLKRRRVAGIESSVSILTNPSDPSRYDQRFGSSPSIAEKMPPLPQHCRKNAPSEACHTTVTQPVSTSSTVAQKPTKASYQPKLELLRFEVTNATKLPRDGESK